MVKKSRDVDYMRRARALVTLSEVQGNIYVRSRLGSEWIHVMRAPVTLDATYNSFGWLAAFFPCRPIDLLVRHDFHVLRGNSF